MQFRNKYCQKQAKIFNFYNIFVEITTNYNQRGNMKKIKFAIIIMIAFLPFVLCACNPNNDQAIANDIDVSVKNFLRTITNMDWPEESDIEILESFNQDHEGENKVFTLLDTEEIDSWKAELKNKVNILLSKRSDLLSASNELASHNVNLTEELFLSIKVYLDIIKDNSNYLTNYTSIIKNQMNEAKELIANQRNLNIVNAYAIKIVETLSIRCAKVDTTILAMNSIIEIVENNLIDNIYGDKKYIAEDTPTPIEEKQVEEEPQEPTQPQINNENNNDIDITVEEDSSENAIRIEPDNIEETSTNESPNNSDV